MEQQHAPEVPVEVQVRWAEEFAAGVVEAFGLDARVRSTVEDDTVHLDVEGEELGLLVGPKGVTLAAIEELARASVQHRTGGHAVRILVDVGGYRRRRREALAEFTRRVAAEVLADDAPDARRALEPMSASDRKVVHDTVAELEGVTTTSEGEDPRRRVVIRRA